MHIRNTWISLEGVEVFGSARGRHAAIEARERHVGALQRALAQVEEPRKLRKDNTYQ